MDGPREKGAGGGGENKWTLFIRRLNCQITWKLLLHTIAQAAICKPCVHCHLGWAWGSTVLHVHTAQSHILQHMCTCGKLVWVLIRHCCVHDMYFSYTKFISLEQNFWHMKRLQEWTCASPWQMHLPKPMFTKGIWLLCACMCTRMNQ